MQIVLSKPLQADTKFMTAVMRMGAVLAWREADLCGVENEAGEHRRWRPRALHT